MQTTHRALCGRLSLGPADAQDITSTINELI